MKRAIAWTLIGVTSLALALVGFTIVSELMKKHARQCMKKSGTNIKAWTTAWEHYYMATQTYLPLGDDGTVMQGAEKIPFSWGNVTADQLTASFKQHVKDQACLKDLDPRDGWGHELQFAVEGDRWRSGYGIRAPGRDGIWDRTIDPYESRICYYFDNDIVLINAQFVQWPSSSAVLPIPFEDNIWGWPLRKAKPPFK